MSRGDPNKRSFSSSNDSNRNLVAALSYLLGFITGIVILFVEKDDKFIRFHAMQSILVFGGLFIVNLIVGLVLEPIRFIGVLSSAINTLLTMVAIIVWAVSMVKAFQGQIFKWPIVGRIAESQVK